MKKCFLLKTINEIMTAVLVIFLFSITAFCDTIWDDGGIHLLTDPTGEYWEVEIYNITQVIFEAGEMYRMRTYGESFFDIDGGYAKCIEAFDSSRVRVGSLSGDYYIYAANNSVIEIIGDEQDFNYIGNGGFRDHGLLEGTLANGQVVSIDMFSTNTINHIQYVPEPLCISLITFGTFVILKRK